ncbi:c-type cytochrome [Azohydromonas caseinilytica]|uniref:Cytochrome c n=1 Tax=Azohydromonas caseinilytica TaxID=2728836 RepID=A0A848FDT7_9BURK|nr:cytochrome c [Azohydromonas caseinilytica]NML16443.1 cytochrome c [Azohydromonas caseinilytica]
MQNGWWRGPGLDTLLSLITTLEQGLLRVLHALGLAPEVHGQPAWPFGVRVSEVMLTLDPSHARQVGTVLLLLGLAVLSLLPTALLRWPLRAHRGAALMLGLVAAGFSGAAWQWPSSALLWAPAAPTSFHRLPESMADSAPLHGGRLYARHCLACHGENGDGDGPRAAEGPLWPPTFNRSLLWRRSDGELFWHIRHGVSDAQGRHTMPALPAELPDAAVWQLVGWLQLHAAGQQLARAGEWQLPLAAPSMAVQCDGGPARPLHALRGQRLRIVALGPEQPAPREDPRFQTIALSPTARTQEGCVAVSEAAWQAYALVAGVQPQALAGTEFLLDRGGWLRARRRPDDAPWSDAMLVCRGNDVPSGLVRVSAMEGDGLDRLLARMDAEPVRPVRGGRLH